MKKNGRSDPAAWHGKAYNFFGDYLSDKYGVRVLKLPVNAGLTCPNRDGSIGNEGCIFCDEKGSASPTTSCGAGIREQLENARASFRRSNIPTRYIAYFQAFTNTYASPEKLRELYDSALDDPSTTGLMIATRPDCLTDAVLDVIRSYARDDFELWLEIGMQSMHDKSLDFLGRGHTHAQTRDAIMRASGKGIAVCAHVILGIPGETWSDMIDTAREISCLPVSGIKIHHLHVIRGTPLERMYAAGCMRVPGFREYVSTVCDFIENLRPDILVHRLLGDRPPSSLIAPSWGIHKGTVLKAIEEEFTRRSTHQGFLFDSADT